MPGTILSGGAVNKTVHAPETNNKQTSICVTLDGFQCYGENQHRPRRGESAGYYYL